MSIGTIQLIHQLDEVEHEIKKMPECIRLKMNKLELLSYIKSSIDLQIVAITYTIDKSKAQCNLCTRCNMNNEEYL